jgi:hypothetical protein
LEPTITVTMDANKVVAAKFQRRTLDVLSLSDNGGGSITGAPGGFDCAFLPNNTYGTGTCTGQRPTDSTVTLTATADSLSSFRGWWSPSACPPPSEGAPPQHLPCFFSSEPTITVILDENKVVAAQFQRKTLDLLSLADNGGGSITGSPGGFDCVFAPNIVYGTGLCTGQRPTDSAVTLTATPDSLSSFRGWYAPFACPPPSPGAPPNYLPCFLSSEQTITVTLDDDKIVAARFQRVTLTTLSYGDNGGGTVTASPGAIACTFAPAEINGTGQCHAEMPTDTVATVTASPGSAATFLGWYAVFACPVPPSPLPPPSAPCLFSTNATISLTMDVSKIIGARFGSRPVADAGDDVSAPEASTVALDGSGSVDPEGDSLEYDWQQVGGPAMLLDATDPVHPRFTTPNVGPTSIVLTFQLTVSDGHGDSLPDVVNITVTNVNHPPVANAGADTAVAENSPVTLDGALSFDPDSDLLTHHWHQTGGSVVALSDADNARPAFTAPLVGVTGETLTFVLTVSDGNATGTDEVHVLVENANHPPSANAGSDQIVQDGDVVQLAGTASDPDGDPLTLGWIQTSGQTVTLSASATLTPAFTAPSVAPGSSETLTFRLDVTDSSGATASDTSTVQVQHPGDPPVCSAARPSQQVLWPPNHQLVPIEILGITNRTLDPVTVVITAVTQDEPVGGLGDGDTSPDAVIQGNRVLLRAERAGGSNGRVYEIRFDAITALGASCSGVVQVGVPPNMKPGIGVVNDGQGFRSTQP